MGNVRLFLIGSIGAAMLAGFVYRPDGSVKVIKALVAPFTVAVKGASGGYVK